MLNLYYTIIHGRCWLIWFIFKHLQITRLTAGKIKSGSVANWGQQRCSYYETQQADVLSTPHWTVLCSWIFMKTAQNKHTWRAPDSRLWFPRRSGPQNTSLGFKSRRERLIRKQSELRFEIFIPFRVETVSTAQRLMGNWNTKHISVK